MHRCNFALGFMQLNTHYLFAFISIIALCLCVFVIFALVSIQKKPWNEEKKTAKSRQWWVVKEKTESEREREKQQQPDIIEPNVTIAFGDEWKK